MEIKEYLDEVAYTETKSMGDLELGDKIVYKSKFDGSYITMEGREGDVKYLADKEITEQLAHGVGFSPKENKWYGWSHRAIHGFEIGSTSKKGDCHYRESTLDEEVEHAINFWSEPGSPATFDRFDLINGETVIVLELGRESDEIMSVSWHYDPENFGRGEWTAETMEDAKQMAIDFSEGVS